MNKCEQCDSEYGEFIINKLNFAYLVMVTDKSVMIEPMRKSNRYVNPWAIAETMQIICTTKLAIHNPNNTVEFLQHYFTEKGWIVNNAD